MQLTRNGRFNCTFLAHMPSNQSIFEELKNQFENEDSEYWTKKKRLEEIEDLMMEKIKSQSQSMLVLEKEELRQWVNDFDAAYKQMNQMVEVKKTFDMFKGIVTDSMESTKQKTSKRTAVLPFTAVDALYLGFIFLFYYFYKLNDNWQTDVAFGLVLFTYNVLFIRKEEKRSFAMKVVMQLMVIGLAYAVVGS